LIGRVAYDARVTNVVMALVWVATGAAAIGVWTVLAGRRLGLSKRTTSPYLLSVGAFLLSCVWLAMPVTAVTTTIDTVRAGDVECGSAWSNLHGSPVVYTDAGPQYDPAYGACQAAAWHRVASLGTAEIGLAVLFGMAFARLARRRTKAAPREVDQVAL
jgi:hypothetical protein